MSTSTELSYRRQYRRMQYLFGPRPAAAPTGWSTKAIAGGLQLSAHPDLNVVSVEVGDVALTLLGYVLDSNDPTAGDEQVLKRLASEWSEADEPFELLDPLGGRFVIVVADGSGVRVVGDANGTLQLFYATAAGETWCAAQSDLLAEHLGLAPDPAAIAYIEQFKEHSLEYAWALDSTQYRAVRRLVPNHYLELQAGAVHRYWPTRPLPQRSVAEVKGAIAKRMSALIEAAAGRFELSMGISAGLDSRLMLAASRPVKDRIVYYTGQDKKRTASHPDVKIPRALLAKLGVEHHVIEARTDLDPEFVELYRASVPYAHEHRLGGLQAQYEQYRFDRVAVIGNVSENARAFYLADTGLPPTGFTAQELADKRGIGHLTFLVERFQDHLDRLDDSHGYSWLDILLWEQGSGSWFAGNVPEFLIAWQDVFLPYNCRALLVDMLSAPLASRKVPATALYRAAAAEVWPEVLAYPINPMTPSKWFYKHLYPPLRKVKLALLSAASSLRGRRAETSHAASEAGAGGVAIGRTRGTSHG